MSSDLTGRKLGQYELRERLGRGGMAEVYKAYQPGMDRFVAVKLMLGHLANDEQFVERFRREAQAVGKLRHPHIVNVFDFGIETDVYYMVMEYITGGTLKQAISVSQRFAVRDALRVTRQMADALDYAHHAGMIHRDLKPANIMFTDSGWQNAILTDFGIARILTESGLTASGMMVGTPAYMSPEAGHGQPADERADIYALGVILYEMLTGEVPYSADTPMAVVMKHIMAPLPSMEHLHLPPSVEMIVLRAMAKQPDERYQSAAAMRDAVDEAITASRTATPTPPSLATPPISPAATAATYGGASATPSPLPTPADALMATNVVPSEATPRADDAAPDRAKPSLAVLLLGVFATLALVAVVVAVATGAFDDDSASNNRGDTVPISVFGGPERDDSTLTPTVLSEVFRQGTATADAADSFVPAIGTTPLPVVVATEAPTEAPTERTTEIPTEAPTQAPTEAPTEPTVLEPTDIPPTTVAVDTSIDTSDPVVEVVEAIPLLSGLSPVMDEIDTRLINGEEFDDMVAVLTARLADNPDDAETWAALSTVYWMQYDYDNATISAERAVEVDDTSLPALLALSAIYGEGSEEQVQRALDIAFQAYRLDDENPHVLAQIAAVYFEMGWTTFGEVYLYRAIEAGGRGYRYARFVGDAMLYDLGSPEEAIPYLTAAEASPVSDIGSYYSLAIAYMKTGQNDAAYELTLRYASDVDDAFVLANFAYVALQAEDYEQAEAWLDRALRGDESSVIGRWVRALLAEAQGDLETADLLFRSLRVQDSYEGWPFLTRITGHVVQLDHAHVQWALGDTDAAIASVTEYIDNIASYEPAIFQMRAEMYLDNDNPEAALTDFLTARFNAAFSPDQDTDLMNEVMQSAVNIAFGDEATDVTMGPFDVYYSLEDRQISYLNDLSDIDDDFVEQWLIERDVAGGLTYLDEILRADPADSEARYTQLYYVLYEDGNVEQAESILGGLQDDDPDNLVTYVARIDFYRHWSQSNFELALTIANDGLEAYPNHPQLLWRRAFLHDQLGQDARAEADFLAARAAGAGGVGYAFLARDLSVNLDDLEYGLDAAIIAYLAYPTSVENAAVVVDYLMRLGWVDEAYAFSQAIALQVTASPYYYNDIAYVAFAAGDYEQMLAWLQVAWLLEPDARGLTQYLLGLYSWYGAGDAENAIRILTETDYVDGSSRYIGIDFGHLRWLDIARIRAASGDPAGALEAMNTVITEYGWWWEVFYIRAQFYVELGDIEAALADLDTAFGLTGDLAQLQQIEDLRDALAGQ